MIVAYRGGHVATPLRRPDSVPGPGQPDGLADFSLGESAPGTGTDCTDLITGAAVGAGACKTTSSTDGARIALALAGRSADAGGRPARARAGQHWTESGN